MNRTEILAAWVFRALEENARRLQPVEVQSRGEHDFDIVDQEGSSVGLMEATAAIHENSMRAIAGERRHGSILETNLKNGWLLMAHNPDSRRFHELVPTLLRVLEESRLTSLDPQTRLSNDHEVAKAAERLSELGIESGGPGMRPGVVGWMSSRGEDSEAYVIGPSCVVNAIEEELNKPDNLRKLASDPAAPDLERHFFVEVDRATMPAAGASLVETTPPDQPMSLSNRATHVWAATRRPPNVVVWRCDGRRWEHWDLVAESLIEAETLD